MVDAEDPVPPFPAKDWIFPLVTHQDLLDSTLTRVPELILSLQSGYDHRMLSDKACPTAALRVAQLAMAETGGRCVLLTASNPALGFGKVKYRDSSSLYGSDGEIQLYGAVEAIAALTKSREERDERKDTEYKGQREEDDEK